MLGSRTSGAAMVNTLLADNVPGGNCLGGITDLGHNLSSDTTCAFTNIESLINTYALLGPLTEQWRSYCYDRVATWQPGH